MPGVPLNPTPLLPSQYGSANSTGAVEKFKNMTIGMRLTHTSTLNPSSSFINDTDNTCQQVDPLDRNILLIYMSGSTITNTIIPTFSRAYPNKGGLYQEFDRRILRAQLTFKSADSNVPTGNGIEFRINTVTIKANNLTGGISEINYKTSPNARAWDTTRQRWYYQSESDQASRRLEPNTLGAETGTGDYEFNVTKLVQRAMANGHTPICFVIYIDTDGQFGLGAVPVGAGNDEIMIVTSENQAAATDEEFYPRLTTWSTTIKGPPRTRRHGIWKRSRAFV